MRPIQHYEEISRYEAKELREEKVLRMLVHYVDSSKCGASVLGVFGTQDVSADTAFTRIRDAPPNERIELTTDLALQGVRSAF